MSLPYHPPLHATAALAQRIERAEIEFCAAAGRFESPRLASLAVGGGLALFSTSRSFLNKTLGLGVGTTVGDRDLDALERFYDAHGEAARVELCPLAEPGLGARLTARGYVLQEFENELARRLPLSVEERASLAGLMPPAVAVARTTAADEQAWLQAVSAGFGVDPGVMRSFLHPAIVRYVVTVDGTVAGGGAAYVHDGALGVFGTATIEAFRRRGAQTALVIRTLLDLGDTADLAIATTEPGSASQRTFERLGFHVMYTRAILVLPLQNPGHGPVRSA